MKITKGFWKTRDGGKARVYATDGGGVYPSHGAIYYNSRWIQQEWTSMGNYFLSEGDHHRDLISKWPTRKKKKVGKRK